MSVMGQAFAAQWRREWQLIWQQRMQWLQPLMFYGLMALLFSLGFGADPDLLAQLAPSLLWLLAMLAVLLALEGLFRTDFEDGTIELWLTAGVSVAWLMLAKLLAHALAVALPLVAISGLLAAWLGVPGQAMAVMLGSLGLGVPILCWVGALGAALTVGLARGGILLALIVLPLYIPVLMFGTVAVQAAAEGRSACGALLLLGSLGLLSVSLIPWAVAAALRVSQE